MTRRTGGGDHTQTVAALAWLLAQLQQAACHLSLPTLTQISPAVAAAPNDQAVRDVLAYNCTCRCACDLTCRRPLRRVVAVLALSEITLWVVHRPGRQIQGVRSWSDETAGFPCLPLDGLTGG